MHKVPKYLSILVVLLLYIGGSQQVSYADEVGSVVSHASINFDRTYIPQPENPIIPDGTAVVKPSQASTQLPQTGQRPEHYLVIIGLVMIVMSIKLKKKFRGVYYENQ